MTPTPTDDEKRRCAFAITDLHELGQICRVGVDVDFVNTATGLKMKLAIKPAAGADTERFKRESLVILQRHGFDPRPAKQYRQN